MATNIFEMFGTIGADDRPANKAIDSVVDNAKRANHTLSNGLGKMGSWATKTGTALTSYVTKPALVAGTALTGLTLWKGLGRLRSLDMAQAKLRGIGIEGKELDRIMETVTETVTGTAFTTADMTNVAATAIASGVKEGKELEAYLKNIANAAAFANVPLDEMAGVFNKVQTQGKLTGEVVQSLGSRGIGILGILADETGTSMEQVSKAISKGEISAEQFYDAMNNYMGGAADEVGATWDVMLMNLGSRLAILGEKFLGSWQEQEGAFYVLKDVLQEFVDFLPTLNDKAAELGQKFGVHLVSIIDKAKELIDWFKSLDSDTQKLLGNAAAGFGILSVGMGPALTAFGKLSTASAGITRFFESASFQAQGFMSSFPGKIGKGATTAFNKFKEFTTGSDSNLSKFWNKTKEVGSGIGETVGNFIPESTKNRINTTLTDMGDYFTGFGITAKEKMGGAFDNVTTKMFEFQAEMGRFDRSGIFAWVDTFKDKMGGLLPSFEQLGEGAKQFMEVGSTAVTGTLSHTTNALTQVVGFALQALGPGVLLAGVLVGLGFVYDQFTDQINAFLEIAMTKGPEIVQKLAEGIVSQLPYFMSVGTELLVGFLDVITENLPMLFDAGIMILHGLIDGVVDNLDMILYSVIMIISTLIQGLLEMMPELMIAGLNLLQGLINGITNNIEFIVQEAQNIADTFAKTIESKLPIIIEKGIDILVSLIEGIVKIIPDLIPIVLQIFTTLVNAIMNNLPQILAGGIKILGTLIDGVIQIIPQLPGVIGQVFSTLVSAILSNLPQILAQGLALMGKLAGGIIQGIPQAIATVPKIFRSVVSAFTSQNWLSIGKNIVSGIANGIKNFGGNIVTAAKGAAKKAFDGAKNFLGIKSPSRLFQNEIGKYIPQGIAVGIDDDADEVQESLTDAAKNLEFTPDIARTKLGVGYKESSGINKETDKFNLEQTIKEAMTWFLRQLIPYLDREIIMDIDGIEVGEAVYPTIDSIMNSNLNRNKTMSIKPEGSD